MTDNLKRNLIVGFIYFVLAIITQQTSNTFVIWPSAGIALAAAVVFGPVILWSVFIASFATTLNYYLFVIHIPVWDEHIIRIFAIAASTTFSTYIAYLIAPKNVVEGASFQNIHIMASRIFAAFITLGVASILMMMVIKYLFDMRWAVDELDFILPWVIGDIVGALVIAPLCYLILKQWPLDWQENWTLETLAIFLIMIAQCVILFGPIAAYLPVAFLQPIFLFLPIIWSAIRFQPLVSNGMGVIAFFIAWVALNQDIGYFPLVYGEDKEIAVQLFFAFMIGVSLVLQLLLIGHQNHQKSITAIMEAKVRQRTAELEEAKRQAEYLSRIDPLTQLNNRRAFFEFGKQVQLQSIRSAESFALIMLDIDHFKKINDSYGHDIGDIALKELAKTLTSNSRGTDIVGRLGGEEFAIILPNTDQNEAQNLAERIRLAISDIHIVEGEADFKFTSSFGIALSHHPSRKVADILKQADAALYQAKAEGRNRVITYVEKGKSA